MAGNVFTDFIGDVWNNIDASGTDINDPFGDKAAADAQYKAQQDALTQQKALAEQAQEFFKHQSDQGIGYIGSGVNNAAQQVGQYGDQALNTLDANYGAAANAVDSGYGQALSGLRGQYGQARGDVAGGFGQGRSDLGSGYQQSRGALDQLAGTQALGAYDALGQRQDRLGSMIDRPGGLYGGFEQDPGYQFRLQQGEQAINRQAAAAGGRGGGATMKALADYNQGLASQEFGNYANRQQAAAGLASSSDAQYAALLQNQAGRSDQAGMAAQGYRAQGLGALGNLGMQYGQAQAGMSAAGGQALGDLASQYGSQNAAYWAQSGQSLGDVYSQLGNQQAGIYGGMGSQLGNLYANAGANMANVAIGVGGNNQSNANNLMGAYQNFAQYGGMQEQADANQKKEMAGMMMAMFSDRRLKANLKPIRGSRYERLGLAGYRWTWNEHANRIGYFGQSEGVIAQDVAEKYPHAVGVDAKTGWIYVDYDELEQLLREVA